MTHEPKITTRRATEADNAFVYGLKRLTMGPYVEATWGWDEDTQRKLHARRFVPEDMDLLMADQEPIGLWRVRHPEDEIVLVAVYLLPAWQSKGIGSSLLRDLIQESNTGQLPIRLQVLRVNERARAFYERFSFEVARPPRRTSRCGVCHDGYLLKGATKIRSSDNCSREANAS